MMHAIATNRPHRASGELAFHVLEVMDAVLRSGEEHRVIVPISVSESLDDQIAHKLA